MELKIYVTILYKHIRTLLLIPLLGGVLGFLVATQLPSQYHALATVYVQKIPEAPVSGEYTCDGYYAQQAAEAYTDTIVGLFESQTVMQRAIFLDPEVTGSRTIRYLKRAVDIQKVAPQLVEIEVVDADQQYAHMATISLFQAVEEKVLSVQDDTLSGMHINLVNSEPLITLKEPMIALFSIVGLMVGLFVSVSYILLREYLLAEDA